ncbi:MAG: HEAT repeat domain-containing protein [Elusimicrobiota bacterium]|jgi:hypothetical protein|nr:HEAT repeat domain-containing protein [Elusimicrobiota bacterium]
MKQLIFILLLIGGVYYLYNSGFLKVIQNTQIDPKGFVSDIKDAVGSSLSSGRLPDKDSSRGNGIKGDKAAFLKIENTVFAAKSAAAAFALVDIAYANGAADAHQLIDRYISAFNNAKDKNKIINMLGKYRDKQSFNILLKFFNDGALDRKLTIRKIASFKSPEVIKAIESAMASDNSAVRKAAQDMHKTLQKEAWYTQIERKQPLPTQVKESMMETPLT